MPPHRWLELSVPLPKREVEAERLADWLLDQGGTAVEERDGNLVTYLDPPSDPGTFLPGVRRHLEALFPGSAPGFSWRWQDHRDWEDLWKRGLGPRRVAPHLVVAPSWVDVELRDGDELIRLDPGMAFGTAEHATTRGCLRALVRYVRRGQRIADVGAGSGILSIAAVRLGCADVLALEMDEASCETAAQNLIQNGIRDRVKVRNILVEGDQPLPGSPLDGVVANLQRHLLEPLLSSFAGSLVPGGWIILSGILVGEQEDLLNLARQQDLLFQEAEEEEGWWTGVFTSPSRSD